MTDIVTTAINAGSFKTLVTALKAADLVKTLEGPGPFTVFSPTDAAFAKLPDGQKLDIEVRAGKVYINGAKSCSLTSRPRMA